MADLGGLDFSQGGGLKSFANPGTFSPQSPAPTNAALELAQSLAKLEPKAGNLATAWMAKEKDAAEVEAKTAALKTMGADFADATRQGLIEPTQNPWFITAYERESHYIKARDQFADLNAQAANWEEQGDPQAFRKRYSEEAAKLAQGYQGEDAQRGFLAASGPATQNALASNEAVNVQRIKAERFQNVGSMVADAVGEANRVNGGNASPAQIYAAIGTLKKNWTGTGGTEEDWDKLVIAGITSAAYNQQDPDLLDALKAPRSEGGTSLYERPGVADSVETDRYRLETSIRSKVRQATEDADAAVKAQGLELQGKAYSDPRFGLNLLTGDFDLGEFIQYGTTQGYSPLAIRSALNGIQAGVADSVALNAARWNRYLKDPANGPDLFTHLVQGETQGYTTELGDWWGDQVLAGRVPYDDAARAVNSAVSRSAQIKAQNTADLKAASDYIGSYDRLNQRVKDATGAAANLYRDSRLGRPMIPEDRARLEQAGMDAARQWLNSNVGDFNGAVEAAKQATAEWLDAKRKRDAQRQQAPAGSNPLRQ